MRLKDHDSTSDYITLIGRIKFEVQIFGYKRMSLISLNNGFFEVLSS